MDARRPLASLAYFVLAAAALGWTAPASPADPADEAVMLVAKPALRDRLYGATILIAKPVGNDQHIGFIVNKPTPLTLGRLFPEHQASQKVIDPIYLGGPVNTRVIFALVQRADSPGKSSVQMAPDLYLVAEREGVDRIIEGGADHARFFAGFVTWEPGELRAEIKRGFWHVLEADTRLVLRKSTEGMWEELLKGLEDKANMI